MLQDFLQSGFLETSASISLFDMVVVLILSFAIGLLIFFVYSQCYTGVMYPTTFGVTLVSLTMITSMLIMAVTSNIVLSLGMVGALSHMVFHSLMKIVLFFCAGAILHETKREYIFELTGLARKMPKLMICFVISAFALVGVPPLTGFISKWYLLEGTIQEGTAIGYVGLSVLMISAFLSAIYLFTIIARVYSPRKEFDYTSLHDVKDPNWYMLFPMGLFCAAIVTLSLYSLPMIHYFQSVATGLY